MHDVLGLTLRMDGFGTFWSASDGVGRAVALLLLAMSVSAWVMILWKVWVLQRARRDVARAVPAFWAAPSAGRAARQRLAALDREQVLLPLLDAATATPMGGTLDSRRTLDSQLTRRLRDALHRGLAHLQFGQVLLASIGSTAPFIGLFGTVWGIYHALASIAAAGSDHDRHGRRPGRRGADHDRRRPGGRHSGRAGLQHVRQVGRRRPRPNSRASPTTCAKCASTARTEQSPARLLAAPGPTRPRGPWALIARRGAEMAFGRLERTPRPAPMSDINMTPLIDVMLVLLVIFIITAPLMTSSLKLDLPKTEGATPSSAPSFIALAIDADGKLFFGDESLAPRSAARSALPPRPRRNPQLEVQLRADQKVAYGSVAELIGDGPEGGPQPHRLRHRGAEVNGDGPTSTIDG